MGNGPWLGVGFWEAKGLACMGKGQAEVEACLEMMGGWRS